MLLMPWRAFSQGDQQKINVAMTSTATLDAWLHLPDDYGQTSQQYPLLIFIHGVGEGGNINDVLRHGVPKMIAKGANMQYTVGGKLFKFITVSPRIAGGWANQGTIQKLIEEMKKNYRVDASRIYLTGLSAGGYGVLNYVASGKELSDNLAAIVPVSSAPIDNPKLPGLCNVAASNLAVWMLCGVDDGFMKYQTDYIARINDCNPTVKAKGTTFAGGHDSGFWDKAYDPGHTYQSQNIYEWMLQYQRGGSTEEPPPVTAPVAQVKNADVTLTLPAASIQLDGSGSTAPGSTISTYTWKQVSGPGTATLTGGATSKATVGQLVAGKYVFSLTITNAGGLTNVAYANITVNAASTGTDCENCKVVITPGGDGGAYINGDNYNIQPGDTICVKAGNYAYIQFYNFTGSASKPLVFINCGGQVRVGDGGNYGLIFNNVKYFKITGSGSADKYGFRIDGVSKRLSTGLAMGKGCTDYEAERIEITGSEAGLMAKVNPDCDPMNQYPNFAIRNVSIHDIYIHDVLGEGMYIGNTAPNGTETVCDGVTKNLLPPRIYNLKVYNNITENTGWDGIQVASAPENVEIYNNSVYNFGTVNKGSQQAGIILGGESNGKVYNNKIIKGTGNALEVFGVGLCLVYNNIISDAGFDGTAAGQDALFVDDRPTDNNFKPLQVYILNNTVVNSARDAIRILNSFGTIGSGNLVQNNLVYNTGSGAHVNIQRGIAFTSTNNVTGQDINAAGFVNAAGKDFHITASSVAIDKGLDFKAYYNYDIDGHTRPQGAAFDAGADEYSTGATTNKPPTANAGSAVTITLPTSTANLNGSNSSDPDGRIASWAWTFVSGPATPTIGNAATAQTAVSGLTKAGNYVFQLAVTDDKGARATAQVTITVQDAPQPPTVNAGTDKSIRLPLTTSSLSGTATANGGATIATYAWTQTGGPVTAVIASATTAATAISGLTAEGAYDFRLTVTDSEGASVSDVVRITVQPAYEGPTANAGSAVTIRLPATTATLTGSGTAAAGSTISTYAWTQTAGPVTAVISAPATASTGLTGLTTAGTYTFRLTVTDDKGLEASATVNVVVNAAFVPPTADAGDNIAIAQPASTTNLTGSGTPAQGSTITSYSWSQTAGPVTATIANPSAAATGISGLSTAGTYTFRLTIRDNNGQTATSTVNVQVLPANVPPAVEAGSNQEITLPASTATLTGTATAASGSSIASYAWTQESGPRTAGISAATSASTGITGLTQVGTYIFKLTARDDKGLSATATVSIEVLAANVPPVVNAGNSQRITLPTNTATLTGTATAASGSSIASYAWTQESGPRTAGISAATSASTGITGLTQVGTYIFKLTARDDKGLSATATVSIEVLAANVPPVVNAGNSQRITLPTNTATLTGTATAASGSSIASYAWTQESGPRTAGISAATSASTGITGLTQEGTYIFKLTARDDKGLSASATVSIEVVGANVPPVVNAGNSQRITLPTNTATLTGTATAASGSSIASYAWTQESGPRTAGISAATSASTGITGLTQEGTYIFKLTVRDDKGLTATATVSIEVVGAAVPPVVNAGNAQTIVLPVTTATLTGSATAASGSSITRYVWAQASGPSTAVIAAQNSASTGVSQLTTAGTYTFRLTATDDKGLSASATVTIQVNEAANIPPVADAGADQQITLPVNSVALSGQASRDQDGFITGWHWAQISGPASATIALPNQSGTSAQELVNAGVYVFELTVTDNRGGTSKDRVTITVNPEVQLDPPVADAGEDQVVVLPESAGNLNGSGSRPAPGSTIRSYAWTLLNGDASKVTISSPNSSQTFVVMRAAGTYRFRLTVTDANGRQDTDEKIITVQEENEGHNTALKVDLTPNPVQNQLRISVTLPNEQPVTVRIFNLAGALQSTHQFGTVLNAVKYIDMSAYTGGMYIVQVQMGPGYQESFKILKAK